MIDFAVSISRTLVLVDLPCDDGGDKEAIQRLFRDGNGNGELIGREESKHRRYRLLHRVLSRIGQALGDDGGVERLDPVHQIRDHGEASVQLRPSSGHVRVVGGDSASAETADYGGGHRAVVRKPVARRRRWRLVEDEVLP